MQNNNYPPCPICDKGKRGLPCRPKNLQWHMFNIHKINTYPLGNAPLISPNQRGRIWKEMQKNQKIKVFSGRFESNRQKH